MCKFWLKFTPAGNTNNTLSKYKQTIDGIDEMDEKNYKNQGNCSL